MNEISDYQEDYYGRLWVKQLTPVYIRQTRQTSPEPYSNFRRSSSVVFYSWSWSALIELTGERDRDRWSVP